MNFLFQSYLNILSKQEIVFIINPIAGKGKNNIEKNINDTFALTNFIPIFVKTERKHHAKEIVNRYLSKGINHFVAVGGDGTVNEVASQLILTDAKLSIIPIGSGNGLARTLGIPLDINGALNRIKDNKYKIIDSGKINGLSFFCTAGVGFDAKCAEKFDKNPNGRGLWNYIKIILTNYFKFIVQIGKLNEQETEYFSITFANASQFGNDAFIAPDAIIDDQHLDCTIILKHPKYFGFILGFLLITKKIRNSKYVDYYRAKHFNFRAKENLLIHIDGESLELLTDTIEAVCVPNSLIVTI